MTRTRGLTFLAAAVMVVAGLTMVRARAAAQAPNAAQLVTQTVADVKFGTLPGFAIERVNPAAKSDSYVMFTFDAHGHPVVSKENDYPRLLIDADQDGTFESEKVISEKIRNCQGLWFDGPTLYGACTDATVSPPPPPAGTGGGRGGQTASGTQKPPPPPAGIYRLQDTNDDDVYETFETVVLSQGAIAEHGPHAIRRAPDGSFAYLSGNHAAIADEHLAPGSLVLDDRDAQLLPYLPNFGKSVREGVHSGVYRWDRRHGRFTVLFGGNRNAYDFAYNLAGEAFLFDSDMEWDINMPWYREVRTVHGVPGGNYGYRDGSGKYPAYYLDSLPPVRDVGRGSPVGVEFYTSYVYPSEFFDNFFEADWSRGRLLYTALTPDGATYRARDDRAEFVHGEPFNITDVEVGPDGMLYFTTGGRNTAGGFWRLRYTGTPGKVPDMSGILAVVRQPQPLSSWGWAAIERVKASMGASFGPALEKVVRSTAAPTADRVRALFEMQRHGAAPGTGLLAAMLKDQSVDLRATAVYIAGVQGGLADGVPKAQAAVAAAALKDGSPVVRRRAAEALVRMGQSADRPSLAPAADIYALLNDPDRFVRWAGRLALERTPRAEWKDRALKETNPLGAIEAMVALVNTAGGESLQPLVDKQFALLKRTDLSLENKLRLFRALQYTVTALDGGLTAAEREQLHGLIVNQFPSPDERLNRELALLLAYAGQPQGIAKILAAVPAGDDNQPLQLHYLYALRAVKSGWTPEQKVALAELLGRASNWRGGAQFVNFVGQMFDQVLPLFETPAEQAMLYEKAPDFAPLTVDEAAAPGPAAAAAPAATAKPPAAPAEGAAKPGLAPAQTPAQGAKPAPPQAAAGGGRGGPSTPLAERRRGRIISRQEMLEETVFQPQQKIDVAAGRAIFEASCAGCHRFGSLGTDHGMPALDLTDSSLRSSKYTLLEAVMLPDRAVPAGLETTIVTTADGGTVRGVVVGESGDTLSLLTEAAQVQPVAKAQIKARATEKRSIMRETQADEIGRDGLRNLAAFLTGAPAGGGSGPAR